MQNEQLAILLENICARIEAAIESASESLVGADTPRHTEKRFIGNNTHGLAALIKNPEEWETVETRPIAMDDLYILLGDLKRQIDVLNPIVNGGVGGF